MYRLVLALLLLMVPVSGHADTLEEAIGRYRVHESSRIHFSIGQMGGAAIEGEFLRFEGRFTIARDFGRSSVRFSLDAASVKAADPRIEDFIRSEAGFDTGNFPTVGFQSTSITRTAEDSASIEGRLTAKGVTRPARFDVLFSGKAGRTLKFRVTGKLSRALFGMDAGTPVFSNMVVLDMDLLGERM